MLLFYNDLDNMDKNLLLTAIRASLEAGSEIMSVYTDPNADFEIEKKACLLYTSPSPRDS